MPRMLTDDMTAHTLPNATFGFSAVKIDKLGATQYTLATIVVDESGSVTGFETDLENAIWAAVNACQLSPQQDNILLRVVAFSDQHREIHGFRPLAGLTRNDYQGAVTPSGSTALHATMADAVRVTAEYARQLVAQDFDVNAALYVATDGLNNHPPESPKAVRDALAAAAKTEAIGTITTVLIGVNDQAHQEHEGRVVPIGTVLEALKTEAGLTQYVGLSDATPKTLAKLGKFISQSISSVSRALTTGGAKSVPQSVTF